MKKIIYLFLLMTFTTVFGQEKLQLSDCYSLAEKHHPLAKQNELIPQQNKLNVDVINTRKYPKIDLSAQASYQSDVIHFPTENPGLLFELPNKDQYKTGLSVNQLIYSGGLIKAAVEDENAKAKTQQQAVSVALYQLKPIIHQLYFSILLFQEKKQLLLAKQKQLNQKLNEVKAGIKYGAVLPSSDAIIEAELLKLNQQLVEIESNKQNVTQALEKHLGITINTTTVFVAPENSEGLENTSKRPELDLFNLQKNQIDYTSSILSKNRMPKVYGFAEGGYGNPGLNMLDNSFQAFYIVGVKVNWNVFDWNKTKKQTQILEINKQFIDTEKEKFERNTSIQLEQQIIEINKYKAFIKSDQSIINLHEKILKTAESQLKNGITTASNYIEKITDLYEAENNLKTHEIQLLLSQANYKTIQGI